MSNFLRREADSFFFRRRVPAPLQARLGQTEIYRSLKTAVRRTARARATHLFIATEKLFRMLEKEDDEFPSTDDIRVAVRRWLDTSAWKQRLKIMDEMSPGGLRVHHETLPDMLLKKSADEGVSHGDNLGQEANAALAAAFFPAGIWRVRRKVVDHMARQRMVFEGTAIITGETFVEQGEVVADGRALPALRRYRLQRSGSTTEVLFCDGRPFVTVGALPGQRVEHHCGDDLYAGRFLFVRPDLWVEFWRVRGPRKRYTSLTRFERVPDSVIPTAGR